jgi:Lsr2
MVDCLYNCEELLMARETITRLVDDLDGGTAERTVSLGWDGQSYEIDLSKKNISSLEKVLKPYLDAGRRVRGSATRSSRRSGRSASSGTADRGKLQDVREWARANGHEVSERGRIPSVIREAYEAAH